MNLSPGQEKENLYNTINSIREKISSIGNIFSSVLANNPVLKYFSQMLSRRQKLFWSFQVLMLSVNMVLYPKWSNYQQFTRCYYQMEHDLYSPYFIAMNFLYAEIESNYGMAYVYMISLVPNNVSSSVCVYYLHLHITYGPASG